MDGFHLVNLERPWFIEVIETDVHQLIDRSFRPLSIDGRNAIIALPPLIVVRWSLGIVVLKTLIQTM